MGIYDELSGWGYPDEVVLPLMRDLVLDPELLDDRMSKKNPFLDEDTVMKQVLDDLSSEYVGKYAESKTRPDWYSQLSKRLGLSSETKDGILGSFPRVTHLLGGDEADFRDWFSVYASTHDNDPDPDAPEHFYDLRGWWKNASPEERREAMLDPEAHLPDTYKMPGHPTFSDESIYHDPSRPETTGGHWDPKGFFRPSAYQRGEEDRYIYDDEERALRQRYTESAFKDDAYMPVSKARGAYQIAPGAYQDYSRATGREGDLNNPVFNRAVRDWYMYRLPGYLGKDVYSDDDPEGVRLAKLYAAYNWGPGNLNKHLRAAQKGGVDTVNSYDWMEGMPKETRDYVNFIVRGQDSTSRLSADKFDRALSRFNSSK